ncbi:hypothetical protein CG002_01500 [Mesoplasma florum]|uniref:alpha-L-fucosidase n=1 Tax=Mesoplasma florum TaxID=2151 RepID=UPI000D087243|nr:alpha-L-fucosidase [Mesoplasma florum]AVN65036.1 hypothetical protein CG002_01500 [Mesoplasma florum]
MEKRIKDFKDLGLGLFIHYGLYSRYEAGEWFWEMNGLTEEKYFNEDTKDFELKANFKKITSWAQTNGFKYIVLTSKHHDGFGLYDSEKLSKYDINWLNCDQRDLISEFIEQSLINGIKPFIYYATMDWIKTNNLNFNEHIDNIYNNVEFLLKKYGKKISGFWFDGNWSELEKDWKDDRLYNMIRKYNQDCIIVNNTGLESKGVVSNKNIDSVTFEQGKIEDFKDNDSLKEKAFEVCYTLNGHWGFAKNDFDFKSPKKVIEDFVEIRKNHGNFLLNIGLNKDGDVGLMEKGIITEFGKWNNLNDNDLQKAFEVIKKEENYYIIKNAEKNYKIYYSNLKSGAHIDNIHYGNSTDSIAELSLGNNEKVISVKYADNKNECSWKMDNNNLIIDVESFSYGINTVVRIIEIKVKKNV